MKASKVINFSLLVFYGINAVPMNDIEGYANAISLLDRPEEGLYYGFAVNNSSHFVDKSPGPFTLEIDED
jgi:hypothetical protein